jgi:putative SOS response-associated peptidase YedK
MPLILTEEEEDGWLNPISSEADKKDIEELIKTYPEGELRAYTVGKLRGRDYLGNVQGISREVLYEDLIF